MSARAKRKRPAPGGTSIAADSPLWKSADLPKMPSEPPEISVFRKNLRSACETGFCKTDKARRAKQELIQKAVNVVDQRANQKYLASVAKLWKMVSSSVQQLASIEYNENKAKVLLGFNENSGFELFRKFFLLQMKFRMDGIETPKLAELLVKFYLVADGQFRLSQLTVFQDCVTCLDEMLKNYTMSELDLPFPTFAAIWKETLRLCSAYSGQNSMAYLLKLLRSLVKRLGETGFIFRIPEVIEDLTNVLKCYDPKIVCGTNTIWFEVVIELFERHSMEHRELLLSQFSTFVLSLPSCLDLKKYAETEPGEVSYQANLFRLIETYLTVAVPDGDFNFVDDADDKKWFKELIGDSLEKVVAHLNELGRVSAYRTKIIPFQPQSFARAALLISRLLILDHHFEKEKEHKLKQGRKRLRGEDVQSHFTELFKSSTAVCLQVMAITLCRWKHRLTENELQFIVGELVPLEKEMKGADNPKVTYYMQCFAELLSVDNGTLSWTDATIKMLWRMGLKYLTFPVTCSKASVLIRVLYPKVVTLFPESQLFLTVISSIARISTFPEEAIDLLGFLLSIEDFDEKNVFRYGLLSDVVDSSVNMSWPFRCQIIQALCDEEDVNVKLGDIFFTLSMLVPTYHISTVASDITVMEKNLMKLYCLGRSVDNPKRKEKLDCCLLIPEIVEFVCSLLKRFVAEETDGFRLIQIWSVFLRYYNGLQQAGYVEESLKESFNSIEEKIQSFFGESEELDDRLIEAILTVGSDISGTGGRLGEFLMNIFHNGHRNLLIAHLLFHIGAGIPVEVGRHVYAKGDFRSSRHWSASTSNWVLTQMDTNPLGLVLEAIRTGPHNAFSSTDSNRITDALLINDRLLREVVTNKNLREHLHTDARNLDESRAALVACTGNAIVGHLKPEMNEEILSFVFSTAFCRFLVAEIDFNRIPPSAITELLLTNALERFSGDDIVLARFAQRVLSSTNAFGVHSIIFAYLVSNANPKVISYCKSLIPRFYDYVSSHASMIAFHLQHESRTTSEIELPFLASVDTKTTIENAKNSTLVKYFNDGFTEKIPLHLLFDIFNANITPEILQVYFTSSARFIDFWRQSMKLEFTSIITELYKSLYSMERNSVYSKQSIFVWIPSVIALFQLIDTREMSAEIVEYIDSSFVMMFQSSVNIAIETTGSSKDLEMLDSQMKSVIASFVEFMEPKLLSCSSEVLYRYLFLFDVFFAKRENYPITWSYLVRFQREYVQLLENHLSNQTFSGHNSIEQYCMELLSKFEHNEIPDLSPCLLLRGFWICFSNSIGTAVTRSCIYEWILVVWFSLKESRCAIAEVLYRFPPELIQRNPVWSFDLTGNFITSFVRSLLFDSQELLPVSVYLRLLKAFDVNAILNSNRLNSAHRKLNENKVPLSLKLFRQIVHRYGSDVPQYYQHLADIEEIDNISIVCLPVLVKTILALASTTPQKDSRFFSFVIWEVVEFCKLHGTKKISDKDRALLAAFAKCVELIFGHFGNNIDFPEHSGVLDFVSCLVSAGLFEYANFFLRRYVDSQKCVNAERRRHMFTYIEPQSRIFLDKLGDEPIAKLFTQIFIGLRDIDAISQLPLCMQLKDDVRAFLCRERCDWAKATSYDLRLTADSFYATGKSVDMGSFPKDIVYENAIRMSVWDTADQVLSFPKKGISHPEKLYATLASLKYDCTDKTDNLIHTNRIETLKTLSESYFLDKKKLGDFFEFHALERLNTGKSVEDGQSGIELSWHLLKFNSFNKTAADEETKKAQMKQILPHLLRRCRILREMNASAPAKKLIDAFSSARFVNPFEHLDYLVEMGRINIEYGENVYTKNLMLHALKKLAAQTGSGEITQENADITIECNLMLSELVCKAEKWDLLFEAFELAQWSAPHLRTKALMQCGRFAEAEYLEKADFIKSEAFALKKKAIKSWSLEIDALRNQREHASVITRNKREIVQEEVHINYVERILQDRCETAMECYLRALKSSDCGKAGRLLIYRITSLLMQNVGSENIVALTEKYVEEIPSYQWIHVVNHLSSHMFKESAISELVKKIITRVVTDHPYHALNYIFFYTSDLTNSNSESEKRKNMANAFLNQCMLSTGSPELTQIFQRLKRAHAIYLQFAEANPLKSDCQHFVRTVRNGKTVYAFRNSLSLFKEKDFLKNVPIPIVKQTLNHDGKYELSEMVRFDQVTEYCMLADGLSRPKVLDVRGSDGIVYRLIAKSEDLRQDSLVQQMFDVANLVITDGDAQALRTYCVLPLNAENGFIEFCQDTTSLCACLVGPNRTSGLHQKFYPEDKTAAAVRDLCLSRRIQEQENASDLFKELCEEIHPAFRFFFYESFSTAREWRRAINLYTYSLAQWSIVCYIVGLGDRHLNNILIDTKTGQLVHIDLGMIFDYSNRVLPIPERVPFRLTRDMVDPLLVDGVQGAFKRVAIETLKKLQEEANILYGIGSLLLTDPISSFKTSKHSVDEQSMFAKTALSRFKQKLSGMDLSDQTQLSADDQVTTLINDARSTENLARMFVGWMAFI